MSRTDSTGRSSRSSNTSNRSDSRNRMAPHLSNGQQPKEEEKDEEYPKYPLQKSTNPLRVGNALEDLHLPRPSRSGASSKWLAPRVTAPTGQLLHAVCPSSSWSTGMLVNSKGCQQGGLERECTYP